MMRFYHERLRNFNIYFISNNSLVLVFLLSSEFLYNEVWFTDQTSKPLEIEDKTKIALVIC